MKINNINYHEKLLYKNENQKSLYNFKDSKGFPN